jgi:hypothetical protein
MKIKLDYSLAEASAKLDIDVTPEDVAAIAGLPLGNLLVRTLNKQGLGSRPSTVAMEDVAGQDSAKATQEELDRPEVMSFEDALSHAREVQKQEESSPEYITIDQWNQQDVPDDYGEHYKVVFRRPSGADLNQARVWFLAFLMQWCKGWSEGSDTKLYWEVNDRMKFLRFAVTQEQAALKLKWLFWSDKSMQNTVESTLRQFPVDHLNACFGPLRTEVTPNTVVQVSGHLLQVFSREIPELSVFFDHRWEQSQSPSGEINE